jgi:hypothetical protein
MQDVLITSIEDNRFEESGLQEPGFGEHGFAKDKGKYKYYTVVPFSGPRGFPLPSVGKESIKVLEGVVPECAAYGIAVRDFATVGVSGTVLEDVPNESVDPGPDDVLLPSFEELTRKVLRRVVPDRNLAPEDVPPLSLEELARRALRVAVPDHGPASEDVPNDPGLELVPPLSFEELARKALQEDGPTWEDFSIPYEEDIMKALQEAVPDHDPTVKGSISLATRYIIQTHGILPNQGPTSEHSSDRDSTADSSLSPPTQALMEEAFTRNSDLDSTVDSCLSLSTQALIKKVVGKLLEPGFFSNSDSSDDKMDDKKDNDKDESKKYVRDAYDADDEDDDIDIFGKGRWSDG